jgi:elongator complex protein 1
MSSEMFYGEDDPALHDVDVMTDMSRPDTAFTRYTAAPSGTSRSSARFVYMLTVTSTELSTR